MKLPKIHFRNVIFLLAVVFLICMGLIWKFNFLAFQKPAENSSPQFLTYVDRGFKDEDRAALEQKISDLENQLAADQELAKDISQWLILGNLKYQLGNLAEAVEIYQTKILANYPADGAALENLAQAEFEMGNYAAAELHWRAAVSVNPWEVTYIKLVDLIQNKFPERQAEIQGILEEAIANIGQTAGLVKRLGMWYEANENYERALSHYEVAKQLAPDDETINDLIAQVKQKMANK